MEQQDALKLFSYTTLDNISTPITRNPFPGIFIELRQ
jgi:hypothetical protein